MRKHMNSHKTLPWTKPNEMVVLVYNTPVTLPELKECKTCGTVHSHALGCDDVYGNFWFHCRCGSTMVVMIDKMLMEATEENIA